MTKVPPAQRAIIVARSGLLGDTLVAMPALAEIRRRWPSDRVVYLGEKVPHQSFVAAEEVLRNTGLVDEFVYFYSGGWHARGAWSLVAAAARLRASRPWLAIVLEDAAKPTRKRLFFRSIGIPVLAPNPPLSPGAPMADRLLRVVGGVEGHVEPFRYPIPADARASAARWLQRECGPAAGRPLLAVGPWSNMPAKRWPLDRFRDAVAELIAKRNVWPIVFGGAEERAVGHELVQAWKAGTVAAGSCSVQESAALLAACRLYVGNDTGTMHLAAFAGTPCVALFSARDEPGKWAPYGPSHTVLRTDPACSLCMRRECTTQGMVCLTDISVRAVVEKCLMYL